jgi:hypothetical protein
MAKIVTSHKDLIEELNQLVAEAHAQAPEAERRQIEKGYEEVIHKLGHLLTVWTPRPAGSGTKEGTCTVTIRGNPPTTFSYPSTETDCLSRGGSWKPKITGHDPHP